MIQQPMQAIDSVLRSNLPPQLYKALGRRDGASFLIRRLLRLYDPPSISVPGVPRSVWENVGLYYLWNGGARTYEAMAVFHALYQQLLVAQLSSGEWVEKGMPLVFLSDCFRTIGCHVVAKRYLMLTLCEDAVRGKGKVPADNSGSYFRLVWGSGMADSDLKNFARQAYKAFQGDRNNGRYPEWILQQLDVTWKTEPVTPQDYSHYPANPSYVRHMMSQLGDSQGKGLEALAEYLLACMPGCHTTRRVLSNSTDYDIVCSIDGMEVDFRSELGRYFVCECKDWKSAVDFTAVAKFCRVLDSVKAKFGILFTTSHLSGKDESKNAEREVLKAYQDRGIVIATIDGRDLEVISNGANFTQLLRQKYEHVRLDTRNRG